MALLRSIATVGGYTMISRLLGFARDILIAATLGAGPVADAFFVAFKLPNFFRRLFAEGAFNAAFVPLFTRHMSEGGREAARGFAEEVLSVFVVTLLFFVTALQVAMPWVMYGFAPGFADDPYRFGLAIQLAANGVQGAEPHALDLARLQQRQIGHGDTNAYGELRKSHPPFHKHHVEVHLDGHDTNIGYFMSLVNNYFMFYIKFLS